LKIDGIEPFDSLSGHCRDITPSFLVIPVLSPLPFTPRFDFLVAAGYLRVAISSVEIFDLLKLFFPSSNMRIPNKSDFVQHGLPIVGEMRMFSSHLALVLISLPFHP
jgi:hypothetical protein